MKTVRTVINGFDVIYYNFDNRGTELQIYKGEDKVYGAIVNKGEALETAVRKVVELSKGN